MNYCKFRFLTASAHSLVGAMLLIFSSPASAKLLYVSPSGNNTNSGQSVAVPVRTIQKAYDLAQPGDTIRLMAGVHSESSPPDTTFAAEGLNAICYVYPKAGTSQNAPITFTADDKALIKTTPQSVSAFAVRASWITFDGLRIQGSKNFIPKERALDIAKQLFASWSSSPADARKSTSDATPEESKAMRQSGIVVTGAYEKIGNAYSGATPMHITIKNSTIRECSGAAIQTYGWADYLTYTGNTIYNNCKRTTSGVSAINFWTLKSTDTQTGTKVVVANNRVFDNANEMPYFRNNTITDGNGVIVDWCQDFPGRFLIQNNLFYGNGGAGVAITHSNNVDVFHNTVYFNVQSPQLLRGDVVDGLKGLAPWTSLGASAAKNCNVQNNLIVGRKEAKSFISFSNSKTEDNIWKNNVCWIEGDQPNRVLKPAGLPQQTLTEPQFVKPDLGIDADFRLKRGSPGIDAGADLGVTTDFRAFTSPKPVRPQGKAPDVGAWEIN